LSFTIAPFAIVAGIWTTVAKTYKWQNFTGWAVTTLGLGLLILIRAGSSTVIWVITPLIVGVGLGLLYTETSFAVLAPIPVHHTGSAMGLLVFSRSAGNV